MEAELKFERENREGVAVVGSYLIDAAHRLGVDIECERQGESDLCAMKITSGRDLLSAPTLAETEQLSEKRRKDGERLACQAKLEKAGEVVVMTNKKTEEEVKTEEDKTEEFKKEFAELPLEKKIANLLELEFMTLSETFNDVEAGGREQEAQDVPHRFFVVDDQDPLERHSRSDADSTRPSAAAA